MLGLNCCYPKKQKTEETGECLGLEPCFSLGYFSENFYPWVTRGGSMLAVFSSTENIGLSPCSSFTLPL